MPSFLHQSNQSQNGQLFLRDAVFWIMAIQTTFIKEEEEKQAEAASSSKGRSRRSVVIFQCSFRKGERPGHEGMRSVTEQEEMQNALQKIKEEISEGVVEQSPLEEKTLLEFQKTITLQNNCKR
ncbi:hypothetical protein CEXT_119151 [Caerostris extrusa]|uniref:Uncharacterized protein n=1 Tax=Caerostris extrusa TaxID=172846 RepID=A0AAV4X926_CAEEX|nr:hypothetical protein CEXT_119151 [Caerostris extrusa]